MHDKMVYSNRMTRFRLFLDFQRFILTTPDDRKPFPGIDRYKIIRLYYILEFQQYHDFVLTPIIDHSVPFKTINPS